MKKSLPFFLLFLLLLCSCGRPNIPEPPHLQQQLVIELFSALKYKNYQIAFNKFKRLQIIVSDNVRLSELETYLKNKIFILKLQNILNSNGVFAAIEYLQEYIHTNTNGYSNYILNLDKQLKELQSLILEIEKENKLTNSLNKQKYLHQEVNSLSIVDLTADLDLFYIINFKYLDSAIAVLEVADNQSLMVKEHNLMLNKTWVNEKLSNKLLSDMNILYFRQGIFKFSLYKDKSILENLLNIVPASFSDVLIKSNVLYLLGENEESQKYVLILNDIFSKYNTEFWFNFNDFKNNNSLDEINTFVKYPFYIYFKPN